MRSDTTLLVVVSGLVAALLVSVALLGLLAYGERPESDALKMIATGTLGALAGILTRPRRET